MKEEESIIYLDIELLEEDSQEIRDAVRTSLHSEGFREVLTGTLYNNLILAIASGRDRFIAFRVPHHNQDYIIKKSQYRNLLNTMLRYAEEVEDYKKCSSIKKIAEKL